MLEEVKTHLNSLVKVSLDEIRYARRLYRIPDSQMLDYKTLKKYPPELSRAVGELDGVLKALSFVKGLVPESYEGLSSVEASRKALYHIFEDVLKEMVEDPFPWNEYLTCIECGMVEEPELQSRSEITMAVMAIAVEQYWVNNLKERNDASKVLGSSCRSVI